MIEEATEELIKLSLKDLDLKAQNIQESIQELRQKKKDWFTNNTENIGTLYAIGRALGSNVDSSYGPKYQFIDGYFNLFIDDYGAYMTLRYQNKLVCSTHNEKLYIPSVCERFISLYKERANLQLAQQQIGQLNKTLEELEDELMLNEQEATL